ARAKSECDFALLAVRELHHNLGRTARIQTSTCFAGKTCALHCVGLREIAIAPEEFFAITGKGAARLIQIEKGNAVAEFQVKRIAGEKCSCLQVKLSLNV